MRVRKFALILLSLALCVCASAQNTKVRGRVTDAETGEGIPFVGLYFKGTTIGISSDLDGYYSLETRDPSVEILTAYILGYDPQEVPIQLHSFQEINFKLKPTTNNLNASMVKPDNRRMKAMLKEINTRKKLNDPELKPEYTCDVYTRAELDLEDPEKQIPVKAFWKSFDFTLEYMDTSVVSGKPYLPVMLSETKSTRYHGRDPYVNKEVINANRISGINDKNFVSQFTGTMHLQTSLYQDFINIFEQRIPSPLNAAGDLYYDYYLIDSLQLDGRKTYYIRFHPGKFVSSPVFDGEMKIDAQDYALREVHAKLAKTGTINWIRDLVIDSDYKRVGDSTWFYNNDKMYLDMSLFRSDSITFTSVMATRQTFYYEPKFSIPEEQKKSPGLIEVKYEDVSDALDWETDRPFPLSEKENGIYEMVDRVKQKPFYSFMHSFVNMFCNSYIDIGPVGIGPVDQLYSKNSMEGHKVMLGLHTSPEFSRKLRLTAKAGYGFGDKRVVGSARMEYLFSWDPERKLTANIKHDSEQFGRGTNLSTSGNVFSSVLSRGGDKRCMINEYYIKYEHENNLNFNQTFDVLGRQIFGNQFVPLLRYERQVPLEKPGDLPPVETVDKFSYTQFHYGARLSWDETVVRGIFIKNYVYSKYPVLVFDVAGAMKGLMSDYSFLRTEMTVKYKLPMPPVGNIKFILNTGKIFGSVPYPLLKLHEGNGTYGLDQTAFALMDYYEFASDTWATLFMEYNMEGFLLGKIPGVRKLNLREIFGFKMTWGMLSDRNNGVPLSETAVTAPMLFPTWTYTTKDRATKTETIHQAGMKPLGNIPYMEAHAGIGNILKLFRLDFNWRLSYRDIARQNFSVTFGLEVAF